MIAAIVSARIRRWWYLVTIGMWRGERAVDIYTDDGKELGALVSSAADEQWWRVWWVSHTACSVRAQARMRRGRP